MAVAVAQDQQTRPKSRKQPPAGILGNRILARWLDGAEPDTERDRLAAVYDETKAAWLASRRREQEIVGRLGEIAREMQPASGSGLDKLIREQARLNAELGILPELRVEATDAYITASMAFGEYLKAQSVTENDALVDLMNPLIKQRGPLRQVLHTLPKPDRYDDALAEDTAICAQLKPLADRKRSCESAFRIAESLIFDFYEQRRMRDQARQGR